MKHNPVIAHQAVERQLPVPAVDHPGNVFLAGESVWLSLDLPEGVQPVSWLAMDHVASSVGHGEVIGPSADRRLGLDVGRLPVGFYRIEVRDAVGVCVAWTTAAVLAAPLVPVRQDSPFGIDSATAWFARDDPRRQEVFARLAVLAGMNWIRDRNKWHELEPEPGVFPWPVTYETSATLHGRHGLKTLQAMHGIPAWACDESLDGEQARRRFPRDLRTIFRYYAALAAHFQGRVQAWEPWNEADLPRFGGHTIEEMCAVQKAAYLGLKRGDPTVMVCWNVFAGSGSPLHAAGILRNEAWPYFESYDIHLYSSPESYERSLATSRMAACGRPIWMTECGVRLPHQPEVPGFELSPEDACRQAAFVARSYASSLFAGVRQHFYFILGNMRENSHQFGLLRQDQTPRPAFVALAAVGRFLAGARCRGRLSTGADQAIQALVFRAWPDGVERDVVVVWAPSPMRWPVPVGMQPRAMYDHLGREWAGLDDGSLELGEGALFLLLEPGTLPVESLTPPPPCTPFREGSPSPVVLQVSLPAAMTDLPSQSHYIETDQEVDLPLFIYHFGSEAVSGTVRVESLPEGWSVVPSCDVLRLEPLERQEARLRVRIPAAGSASAFGGWISLRGEFGDEPPAVLAFRLSARPGTIVPGRAHSIATACDPTHWGPSDPQSDVQIAADGNRGVSFTVPAGGLGGFRHLRLDLSADDIPTEAMEGLALTVAVAGQLDEMSIQFLMKDGAAYIHPVPLEASTQAPQRAMIGLANAQWGWWSRPDARQTVGSQDVRGVLVSLAARESEPLTVILHDMEWVEP